MVSSSTILSPTFGLEFDADKEIAVIDLAFNLCHCFQADTRPTRFARQEVVKAVTELIRLKVSHTWVESLHDRE